MKGGRRVSNEEIWIIRCIYPFALLGLYHVYKWIGHMDKKNGM
jgi:hypothetical protein